MVGSGVGVEHDFDGAAATPLTSTRRGIKGLILAKNAGY
jgi:hypothetical protein